MNEEIKIKMAEREGWDFDPLETRGWASRGKWVTPPNKTYLLLSCSIPTYDNDNDLDRYIRGMDEHTRDWMNIHIAEMLELAHLGLSARNAELVRVIHTLTQEQKLEAIIKAEGWDKSSDEGGER